MCLNVLPFCSISPFEGSQFPFLFQFCLSSSLCVSQSSLQRVPSVALGLLCPVAPDTTAINRHAAASAPKLSLRPHPCLQVQPAPVCWRLTLCTQLALLFPAGLCSLSVHISGDRPLCPLSAVSLAAGLQVGPPTGLCLSLLLPSPSVAAHSLGARELMASVCAGVFSSPLSACHKRVHLSSNLLTTLFLSPSLCCRQTHTDDP